MQEKDPMAKTKQQIEANKKLIASAKTLISKMNKLYKNNNISGKNSMLFMEKLNPIKKQLQKSLTRIEQNLSNKIVNKKNKKESLSYKVFKKKTI